jgi:hypothetical protein
LAGGAGFLKLETQELKKWGGPPTVKDFKHFVTCGKTSLLKKGGLAAATQTQ